MGISTPYFLLRICNSTVYEVEAIFDTVGSCGIGYSSILSEVARASAFSLDALGLGGLMRLERPDFGYLRGDDHTVCSRDHLGSG